MKTTFVILWLIFLGLTAESRAISWQEYKNKYIRNSGYIIDPYNQNRVTSEAQGYGLILSVKNNDKETFDRIYNWTKKNLQRDDKLFSWCWNGRVIDTNNATDGDLLISYALLIAYKKWGDKFYYREFNDINKALKKTTVFILSDNSIHPLLLPAVYGFSNERYEIKIFPSYYIEFALKELSNEDQHWQKLYDFVNQIYSLKNLSTQIVYSLLNKNFSTTPDVDMDVYRVIIYSHLAKGNLQKLREAFKEIDKFFQKKGYIPLKFNYDKQEQDKEESPFCVYRMFYILYEDEKYIKRYKDLKEIDKTNYFCDSLELLLEEK